jgi:hypothetical protein
MHHLKLGLLAAALVTAGAACSGDDGAAPVVVDAAVDAQAIDASTCNGMVCSDVCIDTSLDEAHCGGCTTVCDPGEACQQSACACPPAFVPAEPQFVQQQVDATILQGATLGIGGMLGGTIDAMIVAYPTDTVQTNHAYDLTANPPGTPPFMAVGYDLDLDTLTPSASFYATRGTPTFTRICPAGFVGTLHNGHFVAVMGLMNPTLVPNDCAFDVPMVSFAYGDCPPPS